MSQLALFDSTDAVIVDEGRGRVTYAPRFIDLSTAAEWFAQLRTGIEWRAERRMMYDREIDVPRLVAHVRLDSSPASTPRVIGDAAHRVADRLGVSFNTVGLNLYRDGRDSVAPHNDHLNELAKGFPIALLSLGEMRRMTIRAKTHPRKTVHIDLEPGSLLVMEYDTQLHYTHAVPKTSDRAGERISLAFRVKRFEQTSADRATGFYR
jgi:alkylated DNA repair dioxygenase AlkB